MAHNAAPSSPSSLQGKRSGRHRRAQSDHLPVAIAAKRSAKLTGGLMSKGARHSDRIRDNQIQNRRSFAPIAGRFWVRFRMASCYPKARFSRAKLHRPLSEALKKQNSKGSNSHISVECRDRLLKVNDINGYEVSAKDKLRLL
jgi:hypothetical protein